MKINSNVKILNKNVVLVPYKEHHVEKYHWWMQSKELQELTASEPLSLEEEYQMQQSWYLDDDKCTFIVLDADTYEKNDELGAMIGDTNLYISEDYAEIEIMIAEETQRGRGRGKNAILAMMRYGVEELKIKKFVAKIGEKNEKSLNLFKKLGFVYENFSDVFKEYTFYLNVTEDTKIDIASFTNAYTVLKYL